MISIISPAKTLDFEQKPDLSQHTLPRFSTQTNRLIRTLRQKKAEEIQDLMEVSDNIAQINVARYKNYRQVHSPDNALPCIHAFKGDVYQGLDVNQLDQSDLSFAQNHLRILSGLYGLLRPLDIIQPYRLEMGTRLEVGEAGNLYQFWDNQIVRLLHKELKDQEDNVIVNLASQEYFKAVERRSLKARVIKVDFLDQKNGSYKVISFFAKKARGMMSRYIIKNRINEPDLLQGFDEEGYYYDPLNSTGDHLIFKRDQVPS